MKIFATYTITSIFDIEFNPEEVIEWCIERNELHVLRDQQSEWESIDATHTIEEDAALLESPDTVRFVKNYCGHCLEKSLSAWKQTKH